MTEDRRPRLLLTIHTAQECPTTGFPSRGPAYQIEVRRGGEDEWADVDWMRTMSFLAKRAIEDAEVIRCSRNAVAVREEDRHIRDIFDFDDPHHLDLLLRARDHLDRLFRAHVSEAGEDCFNLLVAIQDALRKAGMA